MQIATVKISVALLTAFVCLAHASGEGKLKIGVKKRVENCTVRTKKGDMVHMHYTVGWRRDIIAYYRD